MRKSYLKNIAIIASLLIVFAMTFAFAYDIFDAHLFAPIDISYAESADTSSSDYYASVESLSTTGSSFRKSLATLITSTYEAATSYSGLTTQWKTTDEDPNNSSNMLWFYSGTSVSKGASTTNREHVWPKDGGDAFPKEQGPSRDLQHMRPTNTSLNTSRSSKQFGEVAQTASNIVKENGSTTYDNLCYTSGNYFYPGVGYRGATARILMYTQVRWGDEYSLQFVLGEGKSKTIGDIETLMKWHLEEPPTAAEIQRNEKAYSLQGNRNPFIDHPEYAERIFCYDGQSYNSKLQAVVATYGTSYTEPITSLTLDSSKTLAVGESTTLSASYEPSNAKRDVTWTSSDTSVATIDANGNVNALKQGTTTITVASKENSSIKATMTLSVKSVSDIEVVGTPSVTEYESGESFNASGLTVNAIYSDNSKNDVTSQCKWLDGVTKETTLSEGTTSVICKYSTFEKTVNGITVTKQSSATVTITRDNVSNTGSYAWYTFKSNGIDGKIFCYANENSSFQMNSGKTACYIYNTTPITNLKSIKVTLNSKSSGKQFEILTYSTSYETIGASGEYPTIGTSAGKQKVTTDGTTWTFNTTDKYFSINYVDSGVVYIQSIEITYGEDDEQECINHVYGNWTTTKEPTATEEGEKSHSCTICGHTETQKIDALGTSDGNIDGNGGNTDGGGGNTGTEDGNNQGGGNTGTEDGNNQGGGNTGTEDGNNQDGGNTGTEDGNNQGGTGEDATPDITYTVKDFTAAVEEIEKATTPQDKQSAIDYAEYVYNRLNSNEKSSSEVVDAYVDLGLQRKALKDMLQSDSSSLSGGAIAGIVIGCVVFTALASVAVVFIIKVRYRKSASRE